MQISLIVLTSPDREGNLQACLRALAGQTQPAAEILVIDDGSARGQAVAAGFELPLRYLWRPQDGRLAYSRNLGASLAQHPGLVFLDSDAILNPHALAYYQLYFEQLPDCAVFGYHANLRKPGETYASSLIPGWEVYAEDERFPWFPDRGLTVHPHLESNPQGFAWSCNFGLRADVFQRVGGFDAERFTGWGYEDVDLGYRLANQNTPLFFSLDTWAETSPHAFSYVDDQQKNRNLHLITPAHRPPHSPQILHDRAHSSLLAAWQSVYGPRKTRFAANGSER